MHACVDRSCCAALLCCGLDKWVSLAAHVGQSAPHAWPQVYQSRAVLFECGRLMGIPTRHETPMLRTTSLLMASTHTGSKHIAASHCSRMASPRPGSPGPAANRFAVPRASIVASATGMCWAPAVNASDGRSGCWGRSTHKALYPCVCSPLVLPMSLVQCPTSQALEQAWACQTGV